MSKKNKKIEYLVNKNWRPSDAERAIIKRNLEVVLEDSRLYRQLFEEENLNPHSIKNNSPLFLPAQLAIGLEEMEDTINVFDGYGDDEVRLFAYSMYAIEIPYCRDHDLEELYDEETVKLMSRMFNKVNPDETDLEYLLWSGELMYQLATGQFGNKVIY